MHAGSMNHVSNEKRRRVLLPKAAMGAVLGALVLLSAACSSQPTKVDPGTQPTRNQACMTECRERKCTAYTGCYERCDEKGMGPAIAGCRSQCDIKFRYCNDACASECDARYPG